MATTAVVGTHPTGMNSCLLGLFVVYLLGLFHIFSRFRTGFIWNPNSPSPRQKRDVQTLTPSSTYPCKRASMYNYMRECDPNDADIQDENLQESYVFAFSYAREFLKLDYVTCGVWYPICNIMSDYCANLNWRRWT